MKLDKHAWDSLMSKLEALEAAYNEREERGEHISDFDYRLMMVIKKLIGLIDYEE